MRVLAFRHEPGGGPGTVSIALAKRGVELECVDRFAGAKFPDVSNAAGLIFLGGGMCANDPLEFLRSELDLIRRAAAAGQPILGICLGAQLIAKALGAKVYPSTVPELGWMPIGLDSSATSDPVFATLSSPTAVFQLHHDTFALPERATRLAHSDAVANQAFRWGRAVYGVQFHPEMTADMVREWSADAGIPVAVETESCCAQLARTCDRIVGGWSALL